MELPDLHARSKGLLMAVPSLAHPTTAILTPGSCSWARVPTSREWGPQLAIRGGGARLRSRQHIPPAGYAKRRFNLGFVSS